MDRFKDDDLGYARWTSAHYGGFVLTRKGRDFGLHTAGCSHIYEAGAGWRMTKAEKLCSVDRDELLRYARRENSGKDPLVCEDC